MAPEVIAVKGGPSDAFKRLRELGSDRLAYVEGLMAKREPVTQIAMLIQNEWKLFQDVQTRTLLRQLYRYQNQYVTPRMYLRYGEPGSEEQKRRREEFEDNIDVRAEWKDLLLVQKARVDRIVAKEAELGVVGAALNKVSAAGEIDNLRKVLKDLTELELDMGILKRADKNTKGTIQNPDGSVTEVDLTETQQPASELRETMRNLMDFIDAEFFTEGTETTEASVPVGGPYPALGGGSGEGSSEQLEQVPEVLQSTPHGVGEA